TVQLSWNRGSTGLLVVAQSDVDKTNQSYYGESKLNYLTTDGAHEGLVPLSKEGPVHDVQWSYSGNEFVVVYGFMPASATVFDKKCKPVLELGTGPYNTIRWNPKGKFLCLAGFGNLPGDMAFWDYADKKQLGTTKAEWSVTCEWSADGCYFMTATTAPRLQVDNG
ncbi:eIF2A domain-containing protein, partial [Cephalotus follicularis]